MRKAYKCGRCLGVYATDQAIRDGCKLRCGVCGGNAYIMGVIQADRAIPVQDRCKCDQSCVHARGPKCECQCGGRNHMTGSEGYTKVLLHDDAVTLTCTDEAERRKRRAIACQYRRAYRAATNALFRLPGYQAVGWIPYDQFIKIRDVKQAISEACRAKDQATRLRKLKRALDLCREEKKAA